MPPFRWRRHTYDIRSHHNARPNASSTRKHASETATTPHVHSENETATTPQVHNENKTATTPQLHSENCTYVFRVPEHCQRCGAQLVLLRKEARCAPVNTRTHTRTHTQHHTRRYARTNTSTHARTHRHAHHRCKALRGRHSKRRGN